MDYLTCKEAADKWGVSSRQVQRLLAANRISGAIKYGRSWMIPVDAQKPSSSGKDQVSAQSACAADLLQYISKAMITMPADRPDAILDSSCQERERLFHQSCLSYFRGDFAEVIRCFEQCEGDFPAKLTVAQPAIGAAISLGDYTLYSEIEDFLQEVVQTSTDEFITAYAELALFGGYLGASAPNMVSDWYKNGEIPALPFEARLIAIRLRVKYLQCIGDYDAMLSAAQTALMLYSFKQEITIPSVYLTFYCALASHMLNYEEQAERYLVSAMHMCLPHGFTTPFAEHVLHFNGLMEKLLEQHYPQWVEPVLTQAQNTIINWISFHNQFTKKKITSLLTLREYEIALLVSRRVPYAKIAEQHCISVSRLKSIVGEIYDKLLVSNRKELAAYIV